MVETPERKTFRASHRFARSAPRKVRLIADMVRGKNVNEALEILKVVPKKGARLLEKVLKSAKTNASLDDKVEEDNLRVVRAHVDGGPVMKRWQARARGRGVRIRRRFCHINVALGEIPEDQE